MLVRVLEDGRRFYDHELSTVEPADMRKARQTGAPPTATLADAYDRSVPASLAKRLLQAALTDKRVTQ